MVVIGEHIFEATTPKLKDQVVLEMPYGHQNWWEEPLTKVKGNAGVKGHTGVS